jgi:MFS family permease
LVAGLVAAVAYAALSLTHSVVIATCALLAETAMVLIGNTASRSVRQSLVPPDMQGRATSAYLCTILGSYPLGALAGGLLVTIDGLRGAFAGAGVLQFAVLALLGPRLLARLAHVRDGKNNDIDLRDVEAVSTNSV